MARGLEWREGSVRRTRAVTSADRSHQITQTSAPIPAYKVIKRKRPKETVAKVAAKVLVDNLKLCGTDVSVTGIMSCRR